MIEQPHIDRRRFLTRTSACLGVAAVASLLDAQNPGTAVPGLLGRTHFAPSAKNVIFLFMGGGPSHVDTFDPKPMLRRRHGQEMPHEILGTQRVTLMTRNQGHFKTAATPFRFRKVGNAGHDMSDLWVHLPRVADDLTFIRSMHTEPINHDPAVTLMQTGRSESGLPCVGSWCSYGLGAENRDLPAFIFMMSGTLDQPITTRYFSSGILPAQHQGVQFFPASDPVQYLNNPPGLSQEARNEIVGGINDLNRIRHAQLGDPEIEARIHAFELACRMQTAVPDLIDIRDESQRTLETYGPDVRDPSTFARQCLLARRLVERGVRFVQLFHRGWDAHTDVIGGLRRQVRDVDQPIAALIRDLKKRGLLESTLVIWGGEFGRTAYGQGDLSGAFGRDHHPRCFTIWLAGGGVKPGLCLGSTDDFGYNLAERPIHVNDLHATILHCLGIDHLRLTYRHGGRDFRLTDLAGDVVREVLA
jgi:Protein of unknown function (DUF1501)